MFPYAFHFPTSAAWTLRKNLIAPRWGCREPMHQWREPKGSTMGWSASLTTRSYLMGMSTSFVGTLKAKMTFQQGLKIISTTKGISKEIVKRILKSTVQSIKIITQRNQLMLHIWLEFLEIRHWLPNTWQCWQESNMYNQHTSIKHPFWMINPRLLAFPFVEISFAQPNVEMCWASSEVSHRAFCPGARQDGLHHTVDANICPFLVGVALGLGEFWVCTTESCWRNLHVDSSNKPFQWLRWSSLLENRSDSVT